MKRSPSCYPYVIEKTKLFKYIEVPIFVFAKLSTYFDAKCVCFLSL